MTVRLGGGEAEARDAAGFTDGRDIVVGEAAWDPMAGVAPELLAHELVHLAQQDPGVVGVGGEGDQEAEAHGAMDAVLAGRPVAVTAGTGGVPEERRFGLVEWFAKVFQPAAPPGQEVPTDEPLVALGLEDQAYVGDQGKPTTPGGQPVPALSGEGLLLEGGRSGGALTDSRDLALTVHEPRSEGVHKTVSKLASEVDLAEGRLGVRGEVATSNRVEDKPGTAVAAADKLRARAVPLQREVEASKAAKERAEGDLAKTRADRDALLRKHRLAQREANGGQEDIAAWTKAMHKDPEYSRLSKQHQEQRSALAQADQDLQVRSAELAELHADADRLGAPGGEQLLEALVAKHKVQVLPVMKEDPVAGRKESHALDADVLDEFGLKKETTYEESVGDGPPRKVENRDGVRLDQGLHFNQEQSLHEEPALAPGARRDLKDRNSAKRVKETGVVAGSDAGLGVRQHRSVERVEGNRSEKLHGTASLSTKGAEVGVGSEHAEEQINGASVKVTTSANGKFRIAVAPQPDTDDYLVSATLTVGAELGGEAAGDSKKAFQDTDGHAPGIGDKAAHSGSGSGSVQLGGSLVLTRTRVLSAEDAKAYLGEVDTLDRGGTPGAALPEFNAWQRVLVAGDMAGNLGMTPEDAAALQDGEAFQFEATGHLGASVGATGSDHRDELALSSDDKLLGGKDLLGGDNGVGASASIKETWVRRLNTRPVQVPDGRGGTVRRIAMTLSATSATDGTLGATVKQGAYASGGASASSGHGRGEAATFHLDPDSDAYGRQFGRISTALTPTDIRALAQDPAMPLSTRSVTRTAQQGRAGDVAVGEGAVSFNVGHDQQSSDQHDFGPGKRYQGGQASGSLAEHAGGSVLGVGYEEKQAHAGSGQASAGGFSLQGDVTHEQSDLLGGVDKDIGELAGADGPEQLAERVGDKSTGGVKGVLARWSSERQTTLTSVAVSEGQVQVLGYRAGYPDAWRRAATYSDVAVISAWMALRTRLRSNDIPPQLEREILEAKGGGTLDGTERKAAAHYARVQAFVRYMQAGDRGPFERVLTRWDTLLQAGEEGTHGPDEAAPGPASEDLGTWTEWPTTLKTTQLRHQRAQGALAALPGQLGPLVNDADGGRERAAALVNDLMGELGLVRHQVDRSGEFTSARAKAQLLQRVTGELASVRREHTSFLGHWDSANGLAGEQRSDPRLEEHAAKSRRADLVRLLQGYKREEGRLYVQAERASDFHDRVAILKEVHELHDVWDGQLRALHQAAALAQEPVTVRETEQLEPDRDRRQGLIDG